MENNDRFKFRVPFYKHDGTFAEFEYTDFIKGVGAYNAGTVYRKGFEQCLGVKDKNGKLIYEGDILATSNNDSREGTCDTWDKEDLGYTAVKWDQDFFCFSCTDWNFEPVDYDSTYSLDFVEVVGNIHENPELLER